MKGREMNQKEVNSLNHGLNGLGSIEELEKRLEMSTCVDIDVCFAEYCWQFASTYGCLSVCSVHCHPFDGCHPYCYG